MSFHRTLLVFAIAASCFASHANAQSWPSRPVKLIVPGGPGTPADVAARAVSDIVAKKLGQSLVVENRPGAQGVLGMQALVKAESDGYTIGLINLQLAAITAIRKNLPFNLASDIVPVTQLTNESPILVVRSDLPVGTLAELIAYAKTKPGALTFGTPGAGSPAHLGMELLSRTAGLQLRHVPYRSIPAALTDLAGGQIDMALAGSAAALTGLASGRIKAIAVSSHKRLEALPQLPTLAEAGLKDLDLRGWTGIVAPAGTPANVVSRLNAEFDAALASPDVVARFKAIGAEGVGGSAADFGALILRESARWKKVVQQAGITAD